VLIARTEISGDRVAEEMSPFLVTLMPQRRLIVPTSIPEPRWSGVKIS